MNSLDPDSAADVRKATEERPAVGFVATGGNGDAVVREVVRAMENGYDCLVAYSDRETTEAVSLVESLGATAVGPLDTERHSHREALVAAARALSHAGIILASTASSPIDYRRSTRKLAESDAFSVDSIQRSGTQSSPTVVAIPAYNEASTIADVVREANPHVDEVVVVDDGSDDDTASAAREAGVTVVEHETNRGYGSALKTAFEEAAARDAAALVCLDADGQHDPADIPTLLQRLEDSDAELVIGNRFAGQSDTPFYRRVCLLWVNVLTNLSMGVVRRRSWVSDTQSGFRAYGSAAVESVAENGKIAHHMGASTDLLHHAHEHDYGIEEVGVTVDYGVENPSNHDPVRHGLTLISNILRTVERERPITIIGIPGFVLSVLGIGLGHLSIVNYLSTSTFPGGIALLAGFSTLIGVLACFTAIILHSLTVHLSEFG